VMGQQVSYTVTVRSNGAGTPTGTVTVMDGAQPVCNVLNLSGGSATCTTNYTFVDPAADVTAAYSRDATLASSTSPVLNQQVNPWAISVAVTSSANPATVGQSVTYTATLSSSDSSYVAAGAAEGIESEPTGYIDFRDNGAYVGTCGARPLNHWTA